MVTPIETTIYDLAAVTRRDLALAAGDRAAAVMATWARWERMDRAQTGSGPARQPGPARRRLGAWLSGLGARLQGLPDEVAPHHARSGEAGAQ